MSPPGEAELLAAARAGQAAAFSRLVDQHQRAVRGFLRRLCCGAHADADDLAQETFVTAWTRIGAFRSGESFRSWLCGIAYRKWLTHRRGEARRLVRDAAADEPAPASRAEASDAKLDASAALSALPQE